MRLLRFLFLVPIALGAAWFAVRWDALPARMATSFDFEGQARDWMSRAGFAQLMGGLAFGIGGLFVLIAALLQRIPDTLINLPHKAYWLALERRTETLRRVSSWLDWLGAGVSTMNAAIAVGVIECNVSGAGRMPFAWTIAILVFVLALSAGVLTFWLRLALRRPPRGETVRH